MKHIDISFVTAAYNREDLLALSLKSFLAQKNVNVEVIVVDDYSKFPIKTTLGKLFSNVKFIRLKKNSGPAAAFNTGIEKAAGDFICTIGSDDLVDEEFARKMINFSLKNDGPVICLSRPNFPKSLTIVSKFINWLINSARNLVLVILYFFNNGRLKSEAFFAAAPSRMVFPKKTLKKFRYNESMRSCEDWDLFLRIMKAEFIYILPETLSSFTYTKNSLSSTARDKNNWAGYYHAIGMLPKTSQKSILVKIFKFYIKVFQNIK